MENFWFYTKIGLDHVLDPQAYDHILFLAALATPFTFVDWKKVLWLVTVFTLTHCLSLGLSVYGVLDIDTGLVEFLIPLTIAVTALVNLLEFAVNFKHFQRYHLILTGFFGLIHGLGFSNYFKMLMAGEDEKLNPLLGFAAGIELSQVIVISIMLAIGWIFVSLFKLQRMYYVVTITVLVILITIPLMVNAFPV